MACWAEYRLRDHSAQLLLTAFISYINDVWLMTLQPQTGSPPSAICLCWWGIVSSPRSVWFPPMWAIQRPLKSLKRKWVKVRESEREGEKNWASLKEDFVFWWLALPERVSLGRQRRTGRRLKGSGGRDVNYSFREKEAAKVCWGPSLWHHRGPFSGSTALRPQRGDFSIYLFNFMPCRPQNGPIPSPKMPRPPFVVGYPSPPPKNT